MQCPHGCLSPCPPCERSVAAKEIRELRALVREAMAKGPERRCPWCWVVALHGNHAPDCRAVRVTTAAKPTEGG